ncbi:ectoine synthase [Streptomyces sp. NPDC001922]|uniref:ectoine synthase n=1 Tax=Streptomyces sp. NPDC001922 TaxID=3364624 RepID=UPI0036CB5902
MIVRQLDEVPCVEWGNGLSRRFLVADDGMGYTVTDTLVSAGTKSLLEYKNHFEACYCISGRGEVIDTAGNSTLVTPGTLYALDRNDAHWLIAHPEEDLRLICVFSPALRGDERHSLGDDAASHY